MVVTFKFLTISSLNLCLVSRSNEAVTCTGGLKTWLMDGPTSPALPTPEQQPGCIKKVWAGRGGTALFRVPSYPPQPRHSEDPGRRPPCPGSGPSTLASGAGLVEAQVAFHLAWGPTNGGAAPNPEFRRARGLVSWTTWAASWEHSSAEPWASLHRASAQPLFPPSLQPELREGVVVEPFLRIRMNPLFHTAPTAASF